MANAFGFNFGVPQTQQQSVNPFAQTTSTVNPAMNLEMNKGVAKNVESRVYGIADTVLNDPAVALYSAQGFSINCEPAVSAKGDIYYNLMIKDTEVAEGEKNEVARIRVASVINGQSQIDNRFAMFLAQIRRELNDYVMEKKLNYWNRAEKKKSAHVDLDSLKVG